MLYEPYLPTSLSDPKQHNEYFKNSQICCDFGANFAFHVKNTLKQVSNSVSGDLNLYFKSSTTTKKPVGSSHVLPTPIIYGCTGMGLPYVLSTFTLCRSLISPISWNSFEN